MIYDIMNDAQAKKLTKRDLKWDFSFDIPSVARFRVNAFNQDRGPAAVFRTIPSVVLSLDELMAPSVFREICMKPRGLVLVTGPTGSGKSTTLAGMIDYINERQHSHILTIEDPLSNLYIRARGV